MATEKLFAMEVARGGKIEQRIYFELDDAAAGRSEVELGIEACTLVNGSTDDAAYEQREEERLTPQPPQPVNEIPDREPIPITTEAAPGLKVWRVEFINSRSVG